MFMYDIRLLGQFTASVGAVPDYYLSVRPLLVLFLSTIRLLVLFSTGQPLLVLFLPIIRLLSLLFRLC